MKKPYREGKTGLNIELNTISILLIVLFLSKDLFPQVPINGFCKYNIFNVPVGYSGLLPLNFNNDSYTDLVLFDPVEKNVLITAGQGNGTFGEIKKYSLPLTISKIVPIVDSSERRKEFMFTDRKAMMAGVYSFSKKGKPDLIYHVKFNSYPDNISTADINKNGTEEVLLSGSAFNGISIIYKDRKKFLSKKIIQGKSYSNAVFSDLTNDGYEDIAAFNVLSDSLEFYYNDELGNFNLTRAINIGTSISLLKSVDIDLDGYQDLLYVNGDSITILYGDFASSYDTSATISTLYHPDKLITGDFNRDGKIDIAYTNYDSSIVSVIYAKSPRTFYPEIIYTRQDSIKDIIPFYSKFINGIAGLTASGKLFTIKGISSLLDNSSITAGAQPGAINYFDNGNNGITDICYIDNFNKTLNCLVRNAAGIPKFYYSYKLFKDHKNILVDNTSSYIKTFYCYSPGKKLIEVLKINFNNGNVVRNQLYSPGAIDELKVNRVKNTLSLYVVYTKQNKLGLEIFEYKEFRYKPSNFYGIDKKPLSSSISLQKNPGIVYWSLNGDSLLLNRYLVSSGTKTVSANMPAFSNDSLKIKSFTGDLLNNGSDETLSYIKTRKKQFAVYSSSKKTVKIEGAKITGQLKFSSNINFFIGQTNPAGQDKLFTYNHQTGAVNRIGIIQGGTQLVIKNLANIKNIKSFFIKNMNFKNYHIVYTDSKNNCITLRQLQ